MPIFDVRNPNRPRYLGNLPSVEGSRVNDVKVADLNGGTILVHSNEAGYGSSANRFLHDITVTADGTLAYLSNWDAGLVLLDLADVADPQVVSVALDVEAGSLDGEVNSHAAWPSEDGRIVVETEEDFAAWEVRVPPGNLTFGDEDPDVPPPGTAVSTVAGDDFEANPTANVARSPATRWSWRAARWPAPPTPPYAPVEVARFFDDSAAFRDANGGAPHDYWGVYKVPQRPFIYGSHRNGGLDVFKLLGKGTIGEGQGAGAGGGGGGGRP